MNTLGNPPQIWLVLTFFTLFLGLGCKEETLKKKELSNTVSLTHDISLKTSPLPCKPAYGLAPDRLPTWSTDELKNVEKRLTNNSFKSSTEKDSLSLLYAKFLWINGQDTKSEVLLNALINSEDSGSEAPLFGWAHYNLGEIFYLRHYLKNQNALDSTWSHHRKAQVIFQRSGERVGLVKSLSRIAVLHERAQAADSATYYFNQSISLAKKIGYAIGLSRPYTHLGFASLGQGDTLKAHSLVEKALKINLECNNYEELPFSLVNKARLRHLSEADSSKLEILEAVKVSRSVGFKLAEIHALYNLSRTASETADSVLAINSCKEVIDLSDQAGYLVYSEAAKRLLEKLGKN